MNIVLGTTADVETTYSLAYKLSTTLVVYGITKLIASKRSYIDNITCGDRAATHLMEQLGSLGVISQIVSRVSA